MNINLPASWVFARAAGFLFLTQRHWATKHLIFWGCFILTQILFLSDASGRTQRMKHHKSSNSAENLELEDWSNFEGWSNVGLI